jgi:Indole-3-glycerol phosphate synthase
VNTLEKIFDYKKEELAAFKRHAPLSELKAKARDLPPAVDFRGALRGCPARFAIIAEIKRRSPSKGMIRQDFDPPVLAREYRDHGAAALSVLTDAHFFGGHLDHLRQVRQAVKLPLLRKDFVWDPYQIYAAREAGADAILLIAAMLERSQIEDLMGLGRDLGMSILVEVHDEAECAAIRPVAADLVGVNNRNLKTFQVDVAITKRLLPLLPSQAIKISESGLDSAAVLEELKGEGVDAFLIGESFMKAESPGKALEKLLRS